MTAPVWSRTTPLSWAVEMFWACKLAEKRNARKEGRLPKHWRRRAAICNRSWVVLLCDQSAHPVGDDPTDNFDDAMFYMNDHSVRKWKPIPMGILGLFTVEELHRCGLFL